MWIELKETDSADSVQRNEVRLSFKPLFPNFFVSMCTFLFVTCSPQWVQWSVSHRGSHTLRLWQTRIQTYSGFTIIQDPTWWITSVSEHECAHSGYATCDGSSAENALILANTQRTLLRSSESLIELSLLFFRRQMMGEISVKSMCVFV